MQRFHSYYTIEQITITLKKTFKNLTVSGSYYSYNIMIQIAIQLLTKILLTYMSLIIY